MHKMSEKGAALLREIEEFRSMPYDDQSGKEIKAWTKGATIGYGHLIGRAEWGAYMDGITESAARSLFWRDLSPFAGAVAGSIARALEQNEFDALVMLAFNIGRSAFRRSSVAKLINDPDAKTRFNSLEAAWKAWNRSQGKVMRGLVNRRQCEWNIYSKNIYQRW